MGLQSESAVREVVRRGEPRLVIDFRYRDEEGRRRRYRRDATVQCLDAARDEAQRLKTEGVNWSQAAPRPPAMLFRDFANGAFAERYLARRCRPATRERYTELLSKHVLKFFGSMRLDEIGAVEFAAYHAELVRQGKQSRLHLSLVRTVLRAAVRWGELKSLPALPRQRCVRKKPLQAPSTEDVENLVSCATGWLRVAIALAAYAGLSVGEICALKVGDIKSNERRLKVRRMVSGSDGEVLTLDEERVVRIVPALDAVLTDEVDPRRASTLRVILNPRGHTPCRQNMLTALKRLQAKWGLPAYSFRALRQWHAPGAVAGHTKGAEVLP